MITATQISTIAHQSQIDGFTIMREYLQLVFLSYLYEGPKSKHIFFKGGTAIRLLLHSPRFSEDLDFSTTLRQADIHLLLTRLTAKLQTQLPSLKFTVLHSGKSGIRYHLKYRTPDFKYPFNLRLGFTVVKKVYDSQVSPLITDFPVILFPIVTHLSGEEILAEKICALASRAKGRDYYDTWWLLAKGVRLNPDLLAHKQLENNMIISKDLLLKKISAFSPKSLNLDLAQFLPKSQKQIIPLLPKLLVEKLTQVLT